MVSDLKTFINKGCKIAAQKKVCFWANFASLSRTFLVEEVSMNWIGRQSVTELEMSLNWMKLNMHFSKLLITPCRVEKVK